MHKIVFIFFIIFTKAIYCQKSIDINSCPFGHEELKNIPVISLYDLNTEEEIKSTKEAASRGEVFLTISGCGTQEKTMLICTKCKYIFDNDTKLWKKHSNSLVDFTKPMDVLIKEFPLISNEDNPSYLQEFQKESPHLEMVYYHSNATKEEIIKNVTIYLKKFYLIPTIIRYRNAVSIISKINESKFIKTEISFYKSSNIKFLKVTLEYNSLMDERAIYIDIPFFSLLVTDFPILNILNIETLFHEIIVVYDIEATIYNYNGEILSYNTNETQDSVKEKILFFLQERKINITSLTKTKSNQICIYGTLDNYFLIFVEITDNQSGVFVQAEIINKEEASIKKHYFSDKNNK